MVNVPIIFFGKFLSHVNRTLNLGNGTTWPGHIALKLNKNFIKDILRNSKTKIIIVAGTNGKTTTAKLISAILKNEGKSVLLNASGANLLNGLASTLLLHSNIFTSSLRYDYAIFEVDENTLPQALREMTPDYLVILNLFRDQLDRYGEVNTIAGKWQNAVKTLHDKTTLILNADDPQVAYLGTDRPENTKFFSCCDVLKRGNKIHEHAVDSVYCPQCGNKLQFKNTAFSHLGEWVCRKCGLKKPESDIASIPSRTLPGLYNQYNINAASLVSISEGITKEKIIKTLHDFQPAFGRQEEIQYNGKTVKIFLSKNPTGFNQSLQTVKDLGGKTILFVLNDRIPDGRDVSWIWDTDLENILEGTENIFVSGDRVYDMALRIKYTGKFKFQSEKFKVFEQLKQAIISGLEELNLHETLYIIPTYTAMLETRKILTGKKIL